MISPATITILATRPYLPPSLRHQAAPRTLTFRFSPAERKVFRRRRPMPVSEWCEQHRVVTMSSLPGPWKNETTPYLAGIMDASFFPSVQEIAICAVPQSGKSEAVNNCIAYLADRAPGPVLYVFPDELTAKENCTDRITPMFTSSPHLRELMSGRDDDAGALKLKLATMPIYMAWAGSVARLKNKPIRYLVMEEIDEKAYSQKSKTETSADKLAPLRTNTFRWNKKIWRVSTPTIEKGLIWQALLDAQVIFEYEVRCPSCLRLQVMRFGDPESKGGLKWPVDQRDPDTIEIKELAWYQCEHCQAHWSDYQRDQAVRAGVWRAKGDGRSLFVYLEAFRPRRIAFHQPAFLSPFISLSKIAAEFLRCKPGGKVLDLTAHKNFCNAYLAEPWHHHRQDRQEDVILALRDDRPAGLVPGGGVVASLLAGVDTQDNGFWYEIRALGYGLAQESWGVRAGFVDSTEGLEEILFATQYHDVAGAKYHVQGAAIDAMGHRTAEVYDLCRKYRGRLIPIKGEAKMAGPHTWTTLEFYPGTKKPIPGGLKMLRLLTGYYKDILAPKLAVSAADPGAWHLHSEYTEEWSAHLCAEFLNDKQEWECQPGRANHGFDCSVYLLALADVLGIKYRPRPGEQPAVASTPKPAIEKPRRW